MHCNALQMWIMVRIIIYQIVVSLHCYLDCLILATNSEYKYTEVQNMAYEDVSEITCLDELPYF